MKNQILPESELKILNEVFKKVDELVQNHSNTSLTPSMVMTASDLEQIHTFLYMDLVKDLVSAVSALKGILNASEEEFMKVITDDGKKSLESCKKIMMLNMLTEIMKG